MNLKDFSRLYIVHPLEAAAAVLVYGFFRVLPLDAASALGGWLFRTVGPLIGGLDRRALRNLAIAFPEKTEAERRAIAKGMWENLGRVAGEYPHLSSLNVYDHDRVTVTGAEYVDQLRDDGKAGFFFSGHIGNWEIVSLGATQRGMPLNRIYRAANNRLVEWLYRRGRAAIEGELIPKGPASVRPMMALLKSGQHMGMLVDQKMNDGIAVPFFGRDAMTAPALAELARKFDCPMVPARVVRTGGARFVLEIFPPLEQARSDDRHGDVAETMKRVNATLEGWIREHPEQWLWLHNRWPAG